MEKQKIDFQLEKYYTTTQIVDLARQGYFPYRSLSKIYAIINSGKILVIARGDNKKKKYYIQGKELVKYAESQKVLINNNNEK